MNITINNKPFNVVEEPADFWGWVAEGRYDREWHLLDTYLRPEHTFLDLGAWVGSHSLYASSITKKIVSVEPDPVAFPILSANLLLNDADQTILVSSEAITGYEGKIKLGSGFLGASTTRANPHAGGSIGAWAEDQVVEVPCTTLRNFIAARNISDPLFIKMDVEGSEEEILKDVDFFIEHKPTLFLSTHTFWWRNLDETATTIKAIANSYRHVLNASTLEPLNLNFGIHDLLLVND